MAPGESAGQDAGPPVRVLPVAPGQTVQATVAQVLGDGRVLLGWRGALFEASTRLSLVPGRSYEFTVAAAGGSIVLSTARPTAPPDLRTALAAGLLGPEPGKVAEILRQLAGALAQGSKPAAGSGTAEGPPTGVAMPLPPAGAPPTAEQLQSLHAKLGHDQEARVLRLAQLPPEARRAEVVAVRETAKARALQLLDEVAGKVQEPIRQAAGRLVDGLNRVESDNARRTEQGSPTWLPLPVVPDGPVRDARMFLLSEPAPDGGEDSATGQRTFTVVLLLDLTRLGELRVDVEVTGRAVAATFLPVRPATTHALVAAMPALREALSRAGLEPGQLRVRNAPDQRLPVADLLAFPRIREGMVDLHA